MSGTILPADHPADDGSPIQFVTDLIRNSSETNFSPTENSPQSDSSSANSTDPNSLLDRVNRIVDETRQEEENVRRTIARTKLQLAGGGAILIALGFSTTGTFWYHLAETDLREGPTGLMQIEPLPVTLAALATTAIGALLLVAARCYGSFGR
ncbi:MAG: hypothetical protein U0892_20460 [Pirellulales bacterium]